MRDASVSASAKRWCRSSIALGASMALMSMRIVAESGQVSSYVPGGASCGISLILRVRIDRGSG